MRKAVKTIISNVRSAMLEEYVCIRINYENTINSIFLQKRHPNINTFMKYLSVEEFIWLSKLTMEKYNEKLFNKTYNKSLGLIKGRHELPVEDYILEDCEEFTKDKLQPIISNRLNELDIKENTINLYITGLTIVTLIAVEELKKMNKIVNIYGFNPNIQEYYLQGTF